MEQVFSEFLGGKKKKKADVSVFEKLHCTYSFFLLLCFQTASQGSIMKILNIFMLSSVNMIAQDIKLQRMLLISGNGTFKAK